jgi:queuine tRNA-ribosyltransferase
LRHLFQVGEPTAARLVSLHNVSWTILLMAEMRQRIIEGTFDALRTEILAAWAG